MLAAAKASGRQHAIVSTNPSGDNRWSNGLSDLVKSNEEAETSRPFFLAGDQQIKYRPLPVNYSHRFRLVQHKKPAIANLEIFRPMCVVACAYLSVCQPVEMGGGITHGALVG